MVHNIFLLRNLNAGKRPRTWNSAKDIVTMVLINFVLTSAEWRMKSIKTLNLDLDHGPHLCPALLVTNVEIEISNIV